MNPIPSLSRVVFSRYFASGIISATGVLALGLLGWGLGGLALGVPLASGALTICFADNPAPARLKALELGFATAASSLCFALVWASVGHPLLQLLLVPLLGFGAGFVSLWGKRALALSFSMLFISIITLGAPAAPSLRAWGGGVAAFCCGGVAYTAYALLLGRLLRSRTKQQALAELLDALAAHLRWLAASYAPSAAGPEADGRAALLQGAVNDALQSARDLVLREGTRAHDAMCTRLLLDALDLFEAQLAAQTDSALLRAEFEGTAVLDLLQTSVGASAAALEALALGLLQDRVPQTPLPAPARWDAIEQAAARVAATAHAARLDQAQSALRALLHTLRQVDQLIAGLGQDFAARGVDADLPLLPDVGLFVSPWQYRPRQLFAHLRPGSPILRHAIRMSLALLAGLLLARALFAQQSHDYWILLTIAVILRPNYGVTRQRLKDRLLGTLLGCSLVALLLALQLPLPLLLLGLYLALALARTFVTTNFRFTAIAATVMALLLARLLQGNTRFLIDQRLLDTAVGAALAWAFSYVLPIWEYQELPRQLDALLGAQRAYSNMVLEAAPALQTGFRVVRKQLFDSLAALTGLYARMLEEPSRQQRALRELAALITHSHLLAAHLASMRVLRALRARRLSPQALEAMLAPTREVVLQRLGSAELGAAGVTGAAADAAGAGFDPLRRRLALIEAEAQRIRQLGQQIRSELAAD
jgi:uncharacterized membrane protein YccC